MLTRKYLQTYGWGRAGQGVTDIKAELKHKDLKKLHGNRSPSQNFRSFCTFLAMKKECPVGLCSVVLGIRSWTVTSSSRFGLRALSAGKSLVLDKEVMQHQDCSDILCLCMLFSGFALIPASGLWSGSCQRSCRLEWTCFGDFACFPFLRWGCCQSVKFSHWHVPWKIDCLRLLHRTDDWLPVSCTNVLQGCWMKMRKIGKPTGWSSYHRLLAAIARYFWEFLEHAKEASAQHMTGFWFYTLIWQSHILPIV